VHLVGFIIRFYRVAQSSECQIMVLVVFSHYHIASGVSTEISVRNI